MGGGGKAGGKGGARREDGGRREPKDAGPRRKVGVGRLTGIVQEWKGKFGWIQPDSPIDHPEARMKRGKVFLACEDVEQDLPGVGCRVSFFVYADGTGLGAMNCVPANSGSRMTGPTRGLQKPPALTPSRPKAAQTRPPAGGGGGGGLRPSGGAAPGKAKPGENGGRQSKRGDKAPDPAARTTISTAPVQGKVVKWLGKFGFIAPDETLDIPETEAKKGNKSGHIYCHANDVEGEMPLTGAVVIFFVYSDPNGIGAEMCQVVEQGEGGAEDATAQADKSDEAEVEADAEMGDGGDDGEKKPQRRDDNKRRERGGRGRNLQRGAKGDGKGGKDDRKKTSGPTGPDLPRERVSEIPITGEVASWKGKFGWIKPSEDVEHPDFQKHKGDIYVHKKDLIGVEELEKGQTVQFYVFSDPSGLGAEEVAVL